MPSVIIVRLPSAGDMGSVRHRAAAGLPRSVIGKLLRKRDSLDTFSWVGEPWRCVLHPREAGNQLLRLFLTFGYIESVFVVTCHHLTPCVTLQFFFVF